MEKSVTIFVKQTLKTTCLTSCRILSFGAGKRSCPGEVLAKNRLFLFITCLLLRFKFLPSESKTAPVHDPRTYRFGTVLHINEYEVIAQSRSQGEY